MSDEARRLHEALTGSYEIERELGHGGMATVYLAKDLRHSRVVAIKVLNSELALAVGGERFLREIAIAAQLQHPHVLTLIDSGSADGFLYYVMPYVAGESLRSRIARDGALPPSDAARLFREIIDALSHAHKHGMVHRDIKPDNVMISDRHALVVDFGVAKAMSAAREAHALTTTGTSLGTPAYMSPEQVAAEPDVDQRADIYSAGIVAYEMLSGEPPFMGNAQQVMSAHMVKLPPPLPSSVPPALARIVMKCLEKQREARYQGADDVVSELEALATPTASFAIGTASGGTRRRVRVALLAAVGVVLAGGAMLALTASWRRERWIRAEAIPNIERLTAAGEYDSAYFIARRVERIVPRDSTLESLWPTFTRRVVLTSQPVGATVYRATFGDTTSWESLGTTPTDSIRLPWNPAISRIRFTKRGYRTVDHLLLAGATAAALLDSQTAPNPEMVDVAGGSFSGALPGLDAMTPVPLSDYLIDRYEITNREYKRFVEAGGYSKPAYWTEPFVKDGRALTFNEAMALLVDRTGRPGPSTWEAGDFPSGEGDVAVGGVSWYEAAAYAKFSGKSLPTLYHWARAATVSLSSFIVPGSNFRGRGASAGSTNAGMSGWGVFDMAGNVREWVYNESGENRYILGGGWSDPIYQFNDAFTQPAFDRSAINGIRLVKYLKDEPSLRVAMGPLVKAFRDFSRERPVSDAEFRTFRTLYDYDAAPLEAKVESVDSSGPVARVEKVTFRAAYGNERVIAYLYLPKAGKPPYQTVVYFPGSNAIYLRTAKGNLEFNRLDWILKSGRALVYPIYKGTYERGDSLRSDYANETISYRDHVVMWGKDLRRTVDYLETRQDIDASRLAYFGWSWGGYLGGIMPAIEPRLKAVVLIVAGLAMERARPEADPINFLPRIRQPVIMLNGRYDHFFPVETAQKPFFRLLGTPPDQKKYVVYEFGHFVPNNVFIGESLSWLDRYLGPVTTNPAPATRSQ